MNMCEYMEMYVNVYKYMLCGAALGTQHIHDYRLRLDNIKNF